MIKNIMILLKDLNCDMYVLSNKKKSILKYSIIPKKIFYVTNKASDLEILEKTLSIQKNHNIDRVVATDFDSTLFLSRNASQLEGMHMPTAPEEIILRLHNKWSFYKLCKELDILTPNTKKVQIKNLSNDVQVLPAVLKPLEEGRQGRGNQKKVKIVKSKQTLRKFRPKTKQPYLLAQDFVAGRDRDISVYAVNGEILVSTVQEKVSRNQFRIMKDHRLEKMAQKIVEHTNFSGLAHFDLRISNKDIPYMIECNPRIWNSISVSIEAGFDYLGAILNNTIEVSETRGVNYGLIKDKSDINQAFIDPFITLLILRKFRKKMWGLPRRIMSKIGVNQTTNS